MLSVHVVATLTGNQQQELAEFMIMKIHPGSTL